MAARVTDAGVKTILDTTIDTSPFITAANLLIDYHLLGQGLTEAVLTEIERWYAAWLACGRDPRAQSVRTDDTTVQYQEGQKDYYFERAMSLDPTGRLRLAATARPATLTVH